jgi:hypothetical protein
MAAPKVAGCFFGGDLQGEPKPAGRLPCSIVFVTNQTGAANEAESRPLPGAACTSLAVFERTRRTRGDLKQCSHMKIPVSNHRLAGREMRCHESNTA